MKKISIIIPAKDEEKRLPVFLKTVIEYCRGSSHVYEIIVVDDGSRDATAQVVQSFQAKFSSLQVLKLDRNHGKGYAVKQGMLAAQGEVVLFLDADGSTGPEEIERHLHFLDEGHDIVVGSRVLTDGHSQVKALSHRRWMGMIFNFLVSSLLIKGIKDTQCGFKMFKAASAKNLFEKLHLEGFGFDLELLYVAQTQGLKIKEVAVNWTHVDGSKVHLIKDSLKMLGNIIQVKYWHQPVSDYWFKWALTIASLWWIYLFFTTQIVVVFDAVGYEELGQMLNQQGWGEFFKDGPHREPLFPWLVAVSMRLGEWLGISYFYPLKVIGITFLVTTMIFSYRLMMLLSLRPWVAALIVFYMGVSPVMTNSSMRLWSEFAAYPWVVLAVIWTIKSWNLLERLSDVSWKNAKVMGHAAMIALMFLLIMSVKAVAEGVLLFYLWPFYWRVICQWRAGNIIKAKQAAVFCLVVLGLFQVPVLAYKACNYYYNGSFAFTNRGDWALYGNTARRMETLTPRSLGAAITIVSGTGICPSLFTQEECDFWSARYSDDIIGQKTNELTQQGIAGKAASKYFIHESMRMVLSNPLQAFLLMGVEAHKLFFWEGAIAFVAYPDWLEQILHTPLFMNGFKLVLAFLSWASFIGACWYCCYRWVKPRRGEESKVWVLFWVVHFIFWYAAMYSLFFILDRYAFPLIALFMVLIAWMVDRLTRGFRR